VVGFVISLATGSHVHLDFIGTGAFAVAAWPGIFSTVPHFQWSSFAVVIWATKLSSFLFYRATLVGHDMRLEEVLNSFSGVFGFWFVTFMWNVCCSCAYLLGRSSTKSNPVFVKVGGLIYLAGLCIETLADAQKWFFKQANPGQFCNVGLWSISQHPKAPFGPKYGAIDACYWLSFHPFSCGGYSTDKRKEPSPIACSWQLPNMETIQNTKNT
jgi:steroid 5-alpha reductase family enzyme